MNTFFTSDTHFGHDRIIQLAKRPFSSVEEMDETMIQRWNEVVKQGDLVYHLGDFSLKHTNAKTLEIFNRLRGHIHFIEGNHDDSAYHIRHHFASYRQYHTVYGPANSNLQKIVLFHYPIRSWDGVFKGSWHLYGHVHGLLPAVGKSLDVGVDNHNFYPLSFEEVREYMSTRPLMTEEEGFPGYIPLEKRF